MDDPDTTRAERRIELGRPKKRSVRGGIAGRKDYARGFASLGASVTSLLPFWSIRAALTCVRNRVGS